MASSAAGVTPAGVFASPTPSRRERIRVTATITPARATAVATFIDDANALMKASRDADAISAAC